MEGKIRTRARKGDFRLINVCISSRAINRTERIRWAWRLDEVEVVRKSGEAYWSRSLITGKVLRGSKDGQLILQRELVDADAVKKAIKKRKSDVFFSLQEAREFLRPCKMRSGIQGRKRRKLRFRLPTGWKG